MRVNFVLSEVAAGLRRNLTMTVAMILTTGISLGLMGTGLLIANMIGDMREIYYDKIQVSIYLADDVTDEQRDSIAAQLDASPEVQEYIYETRAEAYQRFTQQFQEQPALIANTPEDALPESFRVELVNPERYPVIAEQFPNGEAGVDEVRDEGDFLDRLFSLLNGARNGTLAVALVQALAALLLISNTIQLAAFNRRNETNIMRLVGASRWYTQLPFILEAALAGLIGALLAIGGLVLTKILFVDKTLAGPIKAGIIPPVDWSAIIAISPIIAAAGVGLAAVAAYVTLRLYVRL
ncbi:MULTISPECIES: permease-like cell division protein FtsX [unclassified Modestobacter]|uniref:permease-like cell division protein FtsX n=1 Tax=unclassified Modestobacter TaxID=2643866 RepID=UPI0022AA9947|nr:MULTISPECIES: permease-like cell division protein FtsX [unclassified Modestobacter]MCZ2810193.1 permease-like cell division protein FtsX [Modestobacter sp. VKM Ac-2979]MCZ2819367.1 permease-like cell division protein FtsX [Modestobacter sp. VKM Ac-2977]MCZ2841679.1 permease-like cell division protein FtsX [Modestobacter sp. VKM Ac-2980]MCZ2850284.1 permease-like cell division protein FtsX [Modestobacter sp. VKM Ac-2978]